MRNFAAGRRLALSFVAALIAVVPLNAAAQSAFPNKNIRLIVPVTTGGPSDLVARIMGDKLSQNLGRTVIVENKPGASQTLGADFVAKAAPDGYTLLVQASIFAANPLFLPNVPYDVQKDFTPVSNIGSVPLLVTAHPGVPAKNLREFIALVKADVKKYSFATSGLGSAGHLSEETIKRQAGVPDLLIVPYKGAGPAITDTVGGQVSALIDPLPSSYPQVKAGKLTALAVTSARRVSFMPDVPTVAESGLPGFEMVSWYGLWGPAGLPREISSRLVIEVGKAVRSQLATDRLGEQGFDPVGSTSEQFAAYIRDEITRYARIVKEANIKAE
ncbi:MAG: tripartite tricarboxylate transporter substrate binding protein [Proteobacteria bacterium]|nr:tripartite tricarboxylate transporter substrate binding protein [Pseudomonadota bacterium]